jgi:hypothetical protein
MVWLLYRISRARWRVCSIIGKLGIQVWWYDHNHTTHVLLRASRDLIFLYDFGC